MFLLLSFIIAGIMAEDSSVIHYRLKNSSVCLHVKKPPPYQNDQWIFATTVITSGKSINPGYAEKVDYVPENLTLCVHKLNETDSGIYRVSFHDSKFNHITESHTVVVQEVVPRPVIRMSVLHSNLSAGLCTITVNCSIQNDWMLSACNEDGCRTPQRSFRKVNISISTDYRTIVCIGNNHVSTSNVSESMDATCFNRSNPEPKETSQLFLVIGIAIAVFIITCVLTVFMAKKCSSTKNNQTSNVQLIQSQPEETQPQGSPPRPRVSTSSSQADASYENVDATWASQTSNPGIRPGEELGSKQSQEVDTVYSALDAPTVTASLGKSDNSKDMKGYKKMQLETSSQSVPLDEAERTRQIDTVYSMLQKPKSLKSQHHQKVKQDVEKTKT